jgi:tetratricopeptide (TPR) repeat protein
MRFLFICVLLLVFTAAIAGSESDSLKVIIAGNKADTSKVLAYNQLSKLSQGVDSAIYFAQKGLNLARACHFQSGEAACLNQFGNILLRNGRYPEALENNLKSLKIYEDLNDLKGVVRVRSDIGNIYSRQGDYHNALAYFRSVCVLRKQLNEDERLTFFSIGKAHEFKPKSDLDSALFYYQRAYEFSVEHKVNGRIPVILIHLGNVHLKKKNHLLALSYARMAGASLSEISDSTVVMSIYTHMSDIYSETGFKDSAIYFAEKAFHIGERIKYNEGMIDPAFALSKLYENDGSKAFYYYRTARTFQDSIFSRAKLNEIYLATFNENERQRELNEAKLKVEETRKNNIQYAAIAAGLLTFLIFFLLISNSIIVNEKLVRFLGVLSLLMVFEFLNLLLHPYVAAFTHHSPILLLLAMVVIAACLIPTHHKLEKWITQKMVQKNKKARVTVAKKILEKHALEEQV